MLKDPDVHVSEAAWAAVLDGAGTSRAQADPVLVELAALHALDVVRWARERKPDRLDELVRWSVTLLQALGLTS